MDSQTTEPSALPRHVAIVMDGNGRWATERGLTRGAGHREGVRTLRNAVEHCIRRGVPALTVFAFSSENWRRPGREVTLLLELFEAAIGEHLETLHQNGVQLRFIGERDEFPAKLRDAIGQAEKRTAGNRALRLVVAANYGGRWDITRACRSIAGEVQSGAVDIHSIDDALFRQHLSVPDLPDPDLFIRTGGERRISNYLLWGLAYTELYFTEVLWPDFGPAEMDAALAWFGGRKRRFGSITGQAKDNGRD